MRSSPSTVQHVEEERRERHLARAGRRRRRCSPCGPPVSWNGAAARPRRSAIASPSSTRSRAGQRGHRLDHLGHPVGDLVEAAGEDGDLAVAPVHLDPDAVELAVDEQVATAQRPAPPRRRLAPRRRASAAPAGPTTSPTCSSASTPPVSAAPATGGGDARRASTARRTAASGTSAAVGDRPRAPRRRGRPGAGRR